MTLQAARNPRQVSTQDVDSDSRNHEDCADPEAPVTMHTPPVWARIRFATIAAISFAVVFASGHLSSIATNPDNVQAAGFSGGQHILVPLTASFAIVSEQPRQ
jgi:hypothetical protein